MPNMKPILFNADMVCALLDNRKTVTRRVVKGVPTHAERTPAPLPWFGWETETDMWHVKPPYCPGEILYVRETWKQAVCDPAGGGAALTDLYLYKADEPINNAGMDIEKRWHPSIHMPREAARLFLRVTNMSVAKLQDITVDDILREGIQDIEPPPICQKEPHYPESFPRGFDKWNKAKQDDWIKSEARARYIGWCEYADNLRRGFSKIWNACYEKPRPVKGKNGLIDHYESYPWDDICEIHTYRGKPWYVIGKPWYVIGNPWVFVISFERISKDEAYGEGE